MKILRPVKDKISQLFGNNPQIYKRFGMKGHNGIDFASPRGTPVYATDKGKVAYSYNNKNGYGEVIKIKHSWGESIYGHLQSRYVWKGYKVKKGQKIGTVDNTGFSSGNHLHFGVRVNPINNNNGYFGWVDPLPHIFKKKGKIMSIKQLKSWRQWKALGGRLGLTWTKIKNKTAEQLGWMIEIPSRIIPSLKKKVKDLSDKIVRKDRAIGDLNIEITALKEENKKLKEIKKTEISENSINLIVVAIFKKLGNIFISKNPDSDEKKK